MPSLRISFEGSCEDMRGRAFADGLARLIERKTRLMNAGSSMKPRKAQVKDKGLRAKSWDIGLTTLRFLRICLKIEG